MRTCLCMSGQARGVLNGWPSICGNVLNPNVPDIFVHVWGDESDEQVKAIRDLYKPIVMVVEPQRNFKNARMDVDRQRARYPHGASRDDFVDRVYSLFYSLHQANLAKERYRLEHDVHYDFEIRGRFDISFSQPVRCSDYDGTVIHLTDKGIQHMVDDRFAFGPTRLMNIYSAAFSFYDEINRKRSAMDGIFCAETILYETLTTYGVQYRYIPGLRLERVPL